MPMAKRLIAYVIKAEVDFQKELKINLYYLKRMRPRINPTKNKNSKITRCSVKENLQRYKDNSASALSLRDASFIGLGTKMGFRGVNIVNFRLSDIDWKSRSSRLVQEKTGCR